MGHSMLGPHINWKADQIQWLAKAQPRVAKVLLQNVDPVWMAEAHAASPDTFWVGRLLIVPQTLDDPQKNAQDFCNTLLPIVDPFHGIIDALEGYNEIGFTQFKALGRSGLARFVGRILGTDQYNTARQEMQRYAIFETTRAQLLAAQGWKSVVGNFSSGTPELELWPDFYPALEAGDYLGLHEYSANTQAPFMSNLDTWLCRRYQRVYEALPTNLRLPLIITECGIDGGMLGQAQEGWKRYTNTTGYLSDLRWYDESLQADATRWPIVGATVYCYGHIDPHWNSFDIAGEMASTLATYMQANPPLPWTEDPIQEPPDTLVDLLSTELGDEFDDIRTELTKTGEYDHRDLSEINYQVIHHTGTGTTAQTYSNTIALYHVENNDWPAIGYHFLVYSHKVRYVGSLNTARANVWGRNPEVIGIAIVGDYSDTTPAANALLLCKKLCDLLDSYLGRVVPRVGHRDVALPDHGTECPGDAAYGPDGWLQQIQPDGQIPTDEEYIAQLQARIAELEGHVASCAIEIGRLQGIIDGVRRLVG